jgi:hypothetical protein
VIDILRHRLTRIISMSENDIKKGDRAARGPDSFFFKALAAPGPALGVGSARVF